VTQAAYQKSSGTKYRIMLCYYIARGQVFFTLQIICIIAEINAMHMVWLNDSISSLLYQQVHNLRLFRGPVFLQ